ncbi:centrosomal protein of 135 kDa isoform X2 [Cloeon dipterum]|uniref:centrosomal protein of 135 kDa isoform X2 n=1 Tax=Cloeon dipterum TaxID=197152 RepID=UPI00321F8D38
MAPHCQNSEQSRYSHARRKLAKLGYEHPFTIDSLQLVEKLVEDLITSTESWRRYKNLCQTTLEKCRLYEQGVEPYQKENARLVKSNNDMHKKLLNLQEELEDQKRAHQRKLDTMQAEVQRFKIMESQFNKCISELEKECAEKTIRLHRTAKTMVKPAFKPAGSTKGGFPAIHAMSAKENRRSVKQSGSQNDIEKIYFDPPASISHTLETQASNLSQELQKIKEIVEEYKIENSALNAKLSRRDKEIERLENMMDGGIPIKKVVNDLGSSSDKHLELMLKESEDQKHDAMMRAVQLVKKCNDLGKEMKDIDEFACKLKEEKNALEDRLTQCEDNLMRCSNENHELKSRLMHMGLSQGCQCSGKNISDGDKQRLQEKLDTVSRELRDMKEKEKKLMAEIKRLSDKLQSVSRQATVCSRKSSRSTSRSRDPGETTAKLLAPNLPTAESVQQEVDIAKLKAEVERLKVDKERSEARCQKLHDEMASMSDTGVVNLVQQISLKDKELVAVQQENSNLIRENANLKMHLKVAQETTSSTDLRSLLTQVEKDKIAAKSELQSLQAERDAIHEQLKFVTGKLAEQQSQRFDGDRVNQLEIERRELLQQKGSNQTHIANLEQQVRTLEAELTKQRTQYLQLKNLQEQTDANLMVCQGELSQFRKDAAISHSRMSEIKTLQAEVASLREERAKHWAELDRNSGDRDSLKLQLDEKSERIALLQKEINAKEAWISKLEKNLAELKEVLQCKCTKNVHVTTKVKTSVWPKKPSSPSSTPRKSLPPKRWIRNAAMARSPPSTRVTQDSDLANKQDARGLQRELDRLRKELEQATKVQKSSESEIKRLQDDLSTALKDCKISQRDLNSAQREVEDMKQRLQNYVAEVQRIENLLANKEEDRNALLEHFHSLSQEAIELETHNNSLKSEAYQVKHSLEVTESQVTHLEDQLTASKELIFSYESQVVNLTRMVKNLETELRTVKDQSENFEKDLNAVHELCMKLDSQKEALEDELKSSNKRSLELESKCAKLKSELEALHIQLRQELTNKGAIESVLEESREETLKQRMTNEELAQELEKLKGEVAKMQLSRDKEDVERYTRLAAEKSKEAEILRRELTKEKFERARLAEGTSRQSHVQRSTSPATSTHSLKSLSPETSD